jgi:polyhydroxybutyrate depolymerase
MPIPSGRAILNIYNYIKWFCGILFIVLTIACSGGSDNSNSRALFGEPGSSSLISCADTDSCFSNPTLEIGGDRLAQVQIPSDYTSTNRYPLVIGLHGGGTSGSVLSDYMGLGRRVDSLQFVLVLPNGTESNDGGRFWNSTPACCAPSGEEFQIDDVGYIRSLIEEAAATYSIDVDRIGLIGHSNGAAMTLRMVCEASDLVTSAVSLAGFTFPEDASCAPATDPVSVLTMHGDQDEVIFFDGGEFNRGSYLSANETIRRFAVHAGCNSNNPAFAPNLDADGGIDGSETTVLQYADCAEGVNAELWILVGSGHAPFPWVGSAIDSVVGWIIEHPRK